METTTRNSTSPLRRPLVWSHNTSYPGAAGVHSEVGKKAHAIRVTGQRQLSTSLSTIQSIHQKELRSLSQHRKSLESSMLAYTEKMKKISTARLLLAAQAADPPVPLKEPHGSASIERMLASSRNELSRSDFPERNPRVSVDSGIDVTESGSEESHVKTSINRHLQAGTSSTDSPQHRRPASFHSLANQDDVSGQNAVHKSTVSSRHSHSDRKTRQRRSGTAEKPDVFALKLSMQRKGSPRDLLTAENHTDSLSSQEDGSDSRLSITPFPDYKPPSARVLVDEAGVLITPTEDKGRAQGASSRTSQSSSRKSTKTKDNYWSYRRSQPGRQSLPAIHISHHGKSRLPQPEVLPQTARLAAPQATKKHRSKPKRSTKTYHQSFLYSAAVDNVIRSFEGPASRPAKKSALRRASEVLPALDIHDLRQERQRLREETEKTLTEVRENVEASWSDLEHGTEDSYCDHDDDTLDDDTHDDDDDTHNDDTHDDDDDASGNDSGDDTPVPAVSRERSFSAPDVLSHPAQEQAWEEEEEEGEEGGQPGMTASLSNTYSDNENNVSLPSPRKTVQFNL